MRVSRLFVTTALLFTFAAIAGAQEKKGGKKGGGFQLPPMIHIQIADFSDGGRIPNKYTCAASQTSVVNNTASPLPVFNNTDH